jgi:hypothetical protein
MRTRIFVLTSLVLFLLMISACSNGGVVGPFDRFTAQALDSNGNPLSGVSVLVNGSITGISADSSGYFQLDESSFTQGINSVNRVSIGQNGIVLVTREIVPMHTQELIFQYPKSNKPAGAVLGYTYDDYSAEPLEGVQLILMNEKLGLFQAKSGTTGEFCFTGIPEGNYQLTAQKEKYHLGVAGVVVEAGGATYQGVSLQPMNKARFEDGVMVRGYIFDSNTMAPIEGVSLSMTVDTGYMGMPEPWMQMEDGESPPTDPYYGGPGDDPDTNYRESMPPMYDPQYQETTTNADGYFAFTDPAIGYGLSLNYWKDGYLSGNEYKNIYGLAEDLTLSLMMKPLIMTSACGIVKDGNGDPIKGAYVEFIFAGDEIKYYNDDPSGPLLGMPADPGWGGFEDAVGQNEGSGGGGRGAPQAPPGMGGTFGDGSDPLDNPLLQNYRWENQNGRQGASAPYFTGYYSANTDDNGEFCFDSLPAGAYYYFASAYKHQAVSGDLTVVEDSAENNFEFVCPSIPVGSVFGVVKDNKGVPVVDALVNCVQPYVDPFAYTDSNGAYRIDNVPTGNWIVSAFKYGYITDSFNTAIGEDAEVEINLHLEVYDPPAVTTVYFSGKVIDGSTGQGVEGARMIFTTANNAFFSDLTSGPGGFYNGQLIATEYNVLIQHPDYQDLYMRFWVDTLYPQFDFYLWSIYGGSGPWGGIMPGVPGMTDGGSFGGDETGGAPSPQEDPLNSDPDSPFDPDGYFDNRR